MNIDNPARLIGFITENFPSDGYVCEEDGKWIVTDEWLVGTFAGRAFVGETMEDAARQMIDYLNMHVGHDSIVGDIVKRSGWPSESAVKTYVAPKKGADNG